MPRPRQQSILHNQPLAARFGTTLVRLLNDPAWSVVEIAVAWVRRSGTRHLLPALTEFLRRHGRLRMTVGIDLEHTSREGLEDLLSLQAHGDSEISVYHNEGAGVFHPKVYLFRSDGEARLLIGSNNITESGLFVNVEWALEVADVLANPLIAEARAALEGWRNLESPVIRKLDTTLLADLVTHGYVRPEAAIRSARRRGNLAAGAGGQPPLFGSLDVTPPPPPTPGRPPAPLGARGGGPRGPSGAPSGVGEAGRAVPQQLGQVLLMRIRLARVTQTQLPIQLYRDHSFFANVTSLRSAHDDEEHAISPVGNWNTVKVDIPEAKGLDYPALRLAHTPRGVVYTVYDENSAEGRQIIRALEDGLAADPPLTGKTHVAPARRPTLWRFV